MFSGLDCNMCYECLADFHGGGVGGYRGLNDGNIEYVARSIDAVVRGTSSLKNGSR